MKKIIVPAGTIERHENIFADELVVQGRLIVSGVIRVKRIYGSGMIDARRIVAGAVVADILEVNDICANKLIANKIICVTATASAGIIAKDYIEALCVKTGRLTATVSRIETTEASEIIRLLPKRSYIGAVFCSWVKERFMFWRHSRITRKKTSLTASELTSKEPSDIEFEKLMEGYREKYREGGYRLILEATDSEAA